MVVDAGRKKIVPRTDWEVLSSSPARRSFVVGYERSAPSIDRSGGLAVGGPGKQAIDTFFLKSFQEIGFFDQVLVIPQDAFEKIIRSAEDKRRTPDKERSRQFRSELAALKKSHEDGAIDDVEYMRRQREIIKERHKAFVAVTTVPLIFTGLTGLHDVQKYYDDHLVAGIVARGDAFRNLAVDLRVIDPVTGNIVFHAYNRAGWNRKDKLILDQCVLYPVFNAFIDWVNDNSGIGH
jgi:hypothetical protein